MVIYSILVWIKNTGENIECILISYSLSWKRSAMFSVKVGTDYYSKCIIQIQKSYKIIYIHTSYHRFWRQFPTLLANPFQTDGPYIPLLSIKLPLQFPMDLQESTHRGFEVAITIPYLLIFGFCGFWPSIPWPVSYTHLTLPTICSV